MNTAVFRGAIVKNNELILMYTKHYEGDYKRECQNIKEVKMDLPLKIIVLF